MGDGVAVVVVVDVEVTEVELLLLEDKSVSFPLSKRKVI